MAVDMGMRAVARALLAAGAAFVLASVRPLAAEEAHAQAIVADILAEVAKLRASDPLVEPIAFWDFDGTILKGDCAVGLRENGRELFSGLVRPAIEAGFSPVYRGPEGVSRFLDEDYPRMNAFGRFLSWPAVGQMFRGASVVQLDALCRNYADRVLAPWVFASSRKMIDALAKAGVESQVVSGSPDVFVKGVSHIAGIPAERAVGIRLKTVGGRLSTELVYPLSLDEGKVEVIREILNARPHAVAVAAFGNSYRTDGPFMKYVVTQALPGGAKGTAVMINGSGDDAPYRGLFRCVSQDETRGAAAIAPAGNYVDSRR